MTGGPRIVDRFDIVEGQSVTGTILHVDPGPDGPRALLDCTAHVRPEGQKHGLRIPLVTLEAGKGLDLDLCIVRLFFHYGLAVRHPFSIELEYHPPTRA